MEPRDDFSIFAGSEHMFFGLAQPYAMIRKEIESSLCEQVPDTVVERIVAFDEPKWLTIGRRTDDSDKVIVTFFGFCFRATIDVAAGTYREQLPATITFLLGHVDRPDDVISRLHFDLHDDAVRYFDDTQFKDRFLVFRAGTDEPAAE